MARLGDLLMTLQHRLPVPLVRVGYRIAYRLAQAFWYVLRPDVHGVKGILLDGDRVLLVRHTYGDRRRWDVPGGHARSSEPPADAVRREMREELGLDLAWHHIGSIGATTDHKVERVHCFVAQRPASELEIAHGEIGEAGWFPLAELPGRVGDLSRRSLALLDGQAGAASGALDLPALLTAVEDAPPVEAADAVGAELARAIGASEVAFLIADFSGDALIRLGHGTRTGVARVQGRETAERVPISGTSHGRVLGSQEACVEPAGDGWRVYAPVTNRGEAIGVLELTLAERPGDATVAQIGLAAHVLAYVVIANRRFTDLFDWGQRSVPLSLAAEIQHRLLPSAYTCEAAQFTLAAWLEPAGDIAGDTFDFSLDRDVLHLSMTDAMGHAVQAAVLATLFVGALRNARRADVGLREQAESASAALAEHAADGAFVTGQLVRVDLAEGTARIVNGGHPPPVRLRDGHAAPIDLEVDLPFGMGEGIPYREQPLPLQPGDRIVFVTDGMLERDAGAIDLPRLVADSAHLHAREAVRHLVAALLETTDGTLGDDATIMCLDWFGGAPGPRSSHAGSSGRR